MRTAIGICTYNRPKALEKVWSDIVRLSVTNPFVFVALDGPQEETIDFLQKNKIPSIVSPHTGIAHNKNVILDIIKNYDYGFIVEDDTQIKKKGWDLAYITVSKKTGVEHLNLQCPKYHEGCMEQLCQVKTDNPILPFVLTLMASTHRPNGEMMFMTRNAIEKVGGFHNGFNPWGYEHQDWTRRAKWAGLMTTDTYESMGLREGEDYISRYSIEEMAPTLSNATRRELKEKNNSLFKRRKQANIIYEPIEHKEPVLVIGEFPDECI